MKRAIRCAELVCVATVSACAYLPPVPRHEAGWEPNRDHCVDALQEKRKSAVNAQRLSFFMTLAGGLLGIGGGAMGLRGGEIDAQTMKAKANYEAAFSSGIGGILVVLSQLVEPVSASTERYQLALKHYYDGVYGTGGAEALLRCVQ